MLSIQSCFIHSTTRNNQLVLMVLFFSIPGDRAKWSTAVSSTTAVQSSLRVLFSAGPEADPVPHVVGLLSRERRKYRNFDGRNELATHRRFSQEPRRKNASG